MKQSELHEFIKENEPNICQIVVRKNGKEIYSDEWNIPTHILYGEKDTLTSFDTMTSFAKDIGATLDIMKNGEHWFHAKEQMEFLDKWIMKHYC